jgi:amino acid permease
MMNIYSLLAITKSFFQSTLSSLKSKGAISNYSVDTIPDDHKIEVAVVKNIPIKAIQCNITIRRKNTDNV